MKTLQNVLDYWFSKPNDYKKWFFSGTSLDNYIKEEFSAIEQIFALMPLQHSESIQHKNILLDFANNKLNTCDVNDKNTYLNFIEHTTNHKKVLELFGRYPKRNIFLGLESTPEELLYIEENKERQY